MDGLGVHALEGVVDRELLSLFHGPQGPQDAAAVGCGVPEAVGAAGVVGSAGGRVEAGAEGAPRGAVLEGRGDVDCVVVEHHCDLAAGGEAGRRRGGREW